jgi:antirestriction protein ArdC
VIGKLKGGQDPMQEIVAELAAQALCKLVGKQAQDTMGNSYKYIERYAEKMKLSSYSACMKAISETEKVIQLILKGDEDERANTDGQMQAALA